MQKSGTEIILAKNNFCTTLFIMYHELENVTIYQLTNYNVIKRNDDLIYDKLIVFHK